MSRGCLDLADCDSRGPRRLFSTAQAIHKPKEDKAIPFLYCIRIARNRTLLLRADVDPMVHRSHFRTTILVPLPMLDSISKSSMSRLAPGRPIPNPRDVL